jgi:hypothetical protein
VVVHRLDLAEASAEEQPQLEATERHRRAGPDVDVDEDARRAKSIASTAAVDSSSMEALAMSRPVRSVTMV